MIDTFAALRLDPALRLEKNYEKNNATTLAAAKDTQFFSQKAKFFCNFAPPFPYWKLKMETQCH